MVTMTDQHQGRDPEEAESGGRTFDDDRGVMTADVDNVRSSAYSSTPRGRGCGANAICVGSEFDVDKLEHEDGGSTSFAHYSDDDSVEGDELDLCSSFDNGDLSPGSEVPMFGHVCVKDSSKVHFGKTNIYNDAVTIRQIFYTKSESVNRRDEIPKEEGDAGSDCGGRRNETVDSLDTRVHHKVRKWLFRGMGSFLLIVVVVCMILFIPKHDEPLVERIPLGPNGSSWIITRAGWDDLDRNEDLLKLELPVPFVIVSNTETNQCETLSGCKTRVRIIQTKDLDTNGYSDIGFNFLIGGDGNVYEGRGWDNVGAHTKTYNVKSIGISFIGTFDTAGPPEKQLLVAQQLIDLGVKENKITSNYTLLGHRQIKDDGDPGDALYNIIKTWPHWKPSP